MPTSRDAEMANIVRERTRKLREQDIKRLREMWDAGIASGSAGDMKKLRREAREQLKGAARA
jgi:antitoxin ParD1/3/4